MIRLDDYEESEDLTPDMVREYATKAGYGLSQAGLRAPNRGGFIMFANPMRDASMPLIVEHLAAREKRSVQSLLGEINPRMRAGWPTDEELERHAFWMVRTLSDDRIHVLGAYVACEWKRAGIKVECWPCDRHGNKTRRGA